MNKEPIYKCFLIDGSTHEEMHDNCLIDLQLGRLCQMVTDKKVSDKSTCPYWRVFNNNP